MAPNGSGQGCGGIRPGPTQGEHVQIRPSQALTLWRDVSLALVHDGVDLSPRQAAILLVVYLELPPHTVRGLAVRLGVTKPVVTRAITRLGAAGLLERRRDALDGRNVLVARTVAGSQFVERLADTIVAKAADQRR